MGQQKAFASKYDLRRLGSTARMWEKEGAEDGAEGFFSRRCGGGGEDAVDKRIARVEGVTVETKRDSYEKKNNQKNGSDSGGEEENEKLCSIFREAGQGWFDWLTPKGLA